MGTLKGCTGWFFNFNAQSLNLTEGSNGPDLPWSSHTAKNQCQQRELIYTLFERQFNTDHFLPKDLGDLGSTVAVMCRQSYWWGHRWKKSYISSQNYRNLCFKCPSEVKLRIHSR